MDRLIRYRRWVVASLLAAVVAVVVAILAIDDDDGDEEAVDTSGESSTTSTTSTTRAERSTTSTTRPTTTRAPTTTAPPTTAAPATTTPTAPPTVAAAPTATVTTATTTPPPPYRSATAAVTAGQLGSSYTPGLGCAEPAQLRAVTVTHWGYDGGVHQGRLVVHRDHAGDAAAIFGDLYATRFPIQRIVPVEAYGADDQASMRANNTSAFNCRTVAGTSTLSNHAFGRAIDINPLHNPYVRGSTVDPPEGASWADRGRRDPGMIRGGDAVVEAFAARGWSWGGYWNSPDYQHFDI